MKQTCERFKKELEILSKTEQRSIDIGDGESSGDVKESKRLADSITTKNTEPTKKKKTTSFNSSE